MMITRLKERFFPKKLRNPRLYPPPYQGLHEGRAFLVLCSGPTIEKHRPQLQRYIEDNRPVVMGCNHVSGLYALDYHGFSNRRRFIQNAGRISPGSRVLVSSYIPLWVVRGHYQGETWPLMYKNSNEAVFDIEDGILQCSCGTSGLLLTGVAMVMGAAEILIAGMDGYELLFEHRGKVNCLDVKEKYDSFEDNRRHYMRLQDMNLRFLRQQDAYFRKHKGRGLRIITPTVFKDFYDSTVLHI